MKRRYKTAAGLLAGLLLCQNVYGGSLKEPEIQAQAAVVMDMNSGEFLYEKNADEKFYPASIVKLLTALITAENTEPEATVVFPTMQYMAWRKAAAIHCSWNRETS